MNPTANKSDFEDLTTNLKDLAYSYLEKYSPSKQQLNCLLYTSPSPRDGLLSRMPSSA